ncbi:hypothetical protein [Nocardia sp. NBC_00511]|uniref:hypothetical protein n=1 Tax=Nocardia sp. NBC_00511 TaxID=2903591 RepID=UPI0030E17023
MAQPDPTPLQAPTDAHLRQLAAATLAETHNPGWPYGGGGPAVWSDCIDGALGGPAGKYCAAVHPDTLTALLDELTMLRGDGNALRVQQLQQALEHRSLELDSAQRRIAELESERTADGFGLQSLTAQGGVATLTTVPTTEQARELVLTMSLACGRMLDDGQAPNYVEFEVSPANARGYVVHVRRAEGPSPHTLRCDAEARAEAAEARIAELEQRVNELAAQRNPDDEVLVEGSWFHPADLPRILGNYMRGSDEDARKWKDAAVALHTANARIAELEQVTQYATARAVAAESKLDAERAEYAGWRPPAQVIENPEELAPLPVDAVIRTDLGGVARRVAGGWEGVGHSDTYPSEDVDLPVTVLWRPEVNRG